MGIHVRAIASCHQLQPVDRVNMVLSEVPHIVLKSNAICMLILVFKFYITIMRQGKARVVAGSRPPEDEALFGAKAGKQCLDGSLKFKENDEKGIQARQVEQRWLRLVMNDVENVPLGILVSWGSAICLQATHEWCVNVHVTCVWMFTVGRVAHSFAYAYGLQPHRAIGWFAGVVGIMGMSINACVAV